ncbi:conserved hypothetical protein [Candidatus Caldarchaeum subterraneum]|uniref:Uncharacterized protein n=1 Tax=Caldiarchaeum subterraneum TaxID=311458 RepID=E6N475_CALS0|nr:conserved hypothetical protein [Candidatus Caldarchaeum subterraneum]BAJ49923.1 conserved hypothetical protein [Candidatus Caldarchaeum subterraneum]GBC72221.1 hypothetical protein HRbin03_00048 [archaeon HR03]
MDIQTIEIRQTFYETLYSLFKLLENGDPSASQILEGLRELGCVLNTSKIIEEASSEIPQLLGRSIRVELDPATRRLYPTMVNEFYKNAGYDCESDNPDHLTTMLAFINILLREEKKAALAGDLDTLKNIRRIQHRFLNVHLIPILKSYRDRESLKKLLGCIAEYLEKDMLVLRDFLIAEAAHPLEASDLVNETRG